MNAETARSTLYHLHEAGRIAEAAYLESEGEITPEVSAVEHLQAMAVESAAEALAAMVASARATKAAIKEEIARLSAVGSDATNAEAWALEKLGGVLETSGQKKIQAGTFVVKVKKGRERVVVPEGFDVRELPAECLTHRPESWDVNKAATKKWIKGTPDDDHGGVTVERAPDGVDVK